jgi:hypothetical protein
MPPTTNLPTRGIKEDDVRTAIEDVLGHIPPHTKSTVCGDWNARVGNLHPKFGDAHLDRVSEDITVGDRAKWVIGICESKSWFVLNGIQPGPPARYTFERGDKKSCIDLIIASDSTKRVEYDSSTLKTISDHVLVKTHITMPNFKDADEKQNGQTESREVVYKWKEGTCVQNYAESA